MSGFLHYSERPLSALQAEVDDNQDRFAVENPALVELRTNNSQADLRQQGGFLTRLVLMSPSRSEPVDVLYADSEITRPKLPASHIMMPVGPSDWPGGQHGPVRWLWHDLASHITEEDGRSAVATLVPRMSQGMPLAVRQALLHGSAISLGFSVSNRNKDSLELSIGEHFYLNMAESASDLLIDGRKVDHWLGKEASNLIDEGIAQFWPDFSGDSRFSIPGSTDVSIMSKLNERGQSKSDVPAAIGMLLWRRPNQPFICLEPTVGYDLDGSNTNLRVAPQADAMMVTTIIQH